MLGTKSARTEILRVLWPVRCLRKCKFQKLLRSFCHVQMNVSQEEYARMYGVYLRTVEDSRRRRQREQEYEMEHERPDGVIAQRFYSFTHAGKCFLCFNTSVPPSVTLLIPLITLLSTNAFSFSQRPYCGRCLAV